ncbi:hypothetical protein HOLleu_03271 [Holothuria leucospilota]|uniref:Uncharacterized protein n=1 Tax=Holothuria leucospilota TaxID=206669 RepID=A0A9Q1HLT7_HOLLE|nr:hypothetical protein HOLleu_03271 [Holothuria leucospilota]
MHGISRKEHENLELCTFRVVKEGAMRKKYMKYRKPEKCFVHGCRKYGQHFTSLTKHLKDRA